MINITIVASGSRGDVQPYIALGHGLKAAGYGVRLLSSENFETLVREAGLGFASIGDSVEVVLESEAWRIPTKKSGNGRDGILAVRMEDMQTDAKTDRIAPVPTFPLRRATVIRDVRTS